MSKIKGSPGYRAGWCIHYRANNLQVRPEDDTCEAGVRYDVFQGEFRKFSRRPCFIRPGDDPALKAPCSSFRPPTEEEIAANEEWEEGHMRKFEAVMLAIRPWREKHKGRQHAETTECPACKGQLRLSISGYNGHVHGHCSTEGCVSWME